MRCPLAGSALSAVAVFAVAALACRDSGSSTDGIVQDPVPRTTPLSIVIDNAPQPPRAATPATFTGIPFTFDAWDRDLTVVDDARSGERIVLGETKASGGRDGLYGTRLSFNERDTQATWLSADPTSSGSLWLMDLESREREQVGVFVSAEYVSFTTNDSLRLSYPPPTPAAYIDTSGAPVTPPPTPTSLPLIPGRPSNDPGPAPVGFRLFRLPLERFDFPGQRFIITDDSGTELVQFDAYSTQVIGQDLLVTSVPTNSTPEALRSSTVNLYVLHLPGGSVEFLATVPFDHSVTGNDRYIIWSESACTFPRVTGTTYVLDRATGSVRSVGLSVRGWLLSDDSYFGFVRGTDFSDSYQVLLDVQSLSVRATWPEIIPRLWSADGRFSSPYLDNKGGFCPP